MIKKLPAILLLIVSNLVFGQDYKAKLSKASCDCLQKADAENKDRAVITAQMGLCMLKMSSPYSNEIKRDYGIDIIKDISDSEKMKELGVQIGILMLNECQELFEKVTRNVEAENDTDENSYLLLSGTVKKIEKDNFVIFHVVGENNNLTKFYWVSKIESNLDLSKEYNSLFIIAKSNCQKN